MPEPTAALRAMVGKPATNLPVLSHRRVVLVHDWLTGMRGGEKVLDALCALCPDARIFTLLHVPGAVSGRIAANSDVAAATPAGDPRYREMLPFPAAIELFDLDDADLVISTILCAKSVVRTDDTASLYCHSPMRYAWDQFDAHFGRERLGRAGNLLARLALAPIA